jgi:putative flippase GtrA
MTTTVALIPSYQPDTRLLEVLEALSALGMGEVVVDDGSGMGYRPLFDLAPSGTTVISCVDNRGKGAALKVGLRYIQEHYSADTVVVTVDDDGQHAALDAERCARVAAENPSALVLGCRSFEGEGVPLRSRVGNLVTRLVFKVVSGRRVSDTQTGLRAFSAGLISTLLEVGGERYEYEMNVLLACAGDSVDIAEVPIQTIYEDGNERSHFHPVCDSLLIYRGILKFVGSSFVSFLADYALFGLLSLALAPVGAASVIAANVLARAVSATLNYNLNRRYVFRSDEGVATTAVRYALLAASILAVNTLLLWLLADIVGVPALVAKLCVELMLLVVNWVVQNEVVFRGKKG